MQIISAEQFDNYRKQPGGAAADTDTDARVREIIEAVRNEGDAAIRRYAERFDKSSPAKLEVPKTTAEEALKTLQTADTELAGALKLAASHIRDFAQLQRKQFAPFETELEKGLFTGQLIIPVEKAAIYVPAGRFPLCSTVLMGLIPAIAAGVEEIVIASPPMEDGIPDRRILATAALAMAVAAPSADASPTVAPRLRIFSMGGAQAIAALALGTESVPRVSVIAGPGNKYVAAAKRILFGEVGIDFIAGPTDVLIICGDDAENNAELIAADMLAQAEHDPDARARALVTNSAAAEKINAALEKQLAALPEENQNTARASLDAGGIIIIYKTKEEAIHLANAIAPEHLELHVDNPQEWLGLQSNAAGLGTVLKNYGSLFTGSLAAEVLGDYSAGINHTLPTSGSARFTGGLSVRHFLKTVTTLRCTPGPAYQKALEAAEILGRAEGLFAHANAARIRRLTNKS
jgi:histidinol dehydrogenase